ncbi:zinc-dependent alcohol dehydrogenase family protein [Terriglobus tenax]|uniref:zinc-dependent alcohol dehydrogenase family protein n=1 Tax=Terriglobus tenax TaxID=1111115 RepID=UPI0021E0E586|nr:zinc-dependent alcohol dehydrogenase family protein [Terriglobus tenax]
MTADLTMQALVVDSFETGLFRLAQVPRPQIGDHDVLVRVIASGVNPIDSKIRTGKAPHGGMTAPCILGTDMAGIVEEVGIGVSEFEVGDQVYGLAGGAGGEQGSLAQYMAVDADLLAPKPKNLSLHEAAAVPLVALTAYEGLADRAQVQAGDRVLVTGGAGGVGHMAVQIAASAGAQVYATVSAGKAEIVRGYGATPIDRDEPVTEYVQRITEGVGFDLAFDTVGGKPLDDCMSAIRNYGRVASCYGWGAHDLKSLSRHGATYSGVFVLLPLITGERRGHHGWILREITRLIETGQLKPMVDDRRFTFANALEAHELVESGKSSGKVVIDVQPE